MIKDHDHMVKKARFHEDKELGHRERKEECTQIAEVLAANIAREVREQEQ